MLKKPVILCVDDEKTVLNSLEDQLRGGFGHGVDVELAEGSAEGIELVNEIISERRELALVISDQLMPGMKGDEFLINVHQLLPETFKVLLTGQAGLDAVRNVINNAGLYRYITKPWEVHDLLLTVNEALRSYKQTAQLAEYHVYTRLLRSLNRASHEISSEIQVNALIDKFLKIAIECTNANRGILILRDNDKAYKVEAMGVAGQSHANRLKVFSEVEVNLLTQHIMANIDVLMEFQQENAMQLAAKVTHKQNDLGYIYLEQGASGRTFSPYHREMLDMLASQAAISIENAQLLQQLNEQTGTLIQQRDHLEHSRRIIEQKNLDITDSIRYAKRIQQSFMPNMELLKRHFPESFVLLKPRDIVSGDFYWWHLLNEQFVIAAVDCTGHGVPGAFMSVVGQNFLNQIVGEYAISDPAVILHYLDLRVRSALNQDDASVVTNDGMDIALCTIDKSERRVYFSSANRSLYVHRAGEIFELTGAKCSIGEKIMDGHNRVFQAESFDLINEDVLYLFSDGITDQFGGHERRKFTPRRFKETLVQLAQLPTPQQGEILNLMMEDWRGDIEQTDDILVIGLKFSY